MISHATYFQNRISSVASDVATYVLLGAIKQPPGSKRRHRLAAATIAPRINRALVNSGELCSFTLLDLFTGTCDLGEGLCVVAEK